MSKHRLFRTTVFIVSYLSASAFYLALIYMPIILSESANLYVNQDVLLIIWVVLLAYVFTLPFVGFLANKIGTKDQIKFAAILYVIFSYLCIALPLGLNSREDNYRANVFIIPPNNFEFCIACLYEGSIASSEI